MKASSKASSRAEGPGASVADFAEPSPLAIEVRNLHKRFRVPTDIHQLLSGVQPPVTIRGPLLEEEAMAPHEGYWAAARVDLTAGSSAGE